MIINYDNGDDFDFLVLKLFFATIAALYSEMEKAANLADISVLFFSSVANFGAESVLLESQCYRYC